MGKRYSARIVHLDKRHSEIGYIIIDEKDFDNREEAVQYYNSIDTGLKDDKQLLDTEENETLFQSHDNEWQPEN